MNFAIINGRIEPATHKATHQDGGDDEVSVVALSGELADDQHVLDAEVLAVAAALVHAARHAIGGADPLRWTDAKLLLGAGAGADPTEIDVPTPPTRTIYILPVMTTGTAFALTNGIHWSTRLDQVNEYVTWEFSVPADFGSLVTVKVIYIGTQPGGNYFDWTATTEFGAIGEQYNANTDSDTEDGATPSATGIISMVDISAAFTAIAAGDFVGVKWLIDFIGGTPLMDVIGLEFKYSEA